MSEPIGKSRGRGRGRGRGADRPGPPGVQTPALQGSWARRAGPTAQPQPQEQAQFPPGPQRPRPPAQPEHQSQSPQGAWGTAGSSTQVQTQPLPQQQHQKQAWVTYPSAQPRAQQDAQLPAGLPKLVPQTTQGAPPRSIGRGSQRGEAGSSADPSQVSERMQNLAIGGEAAPVSRGGMRGRRLIQNVTIVTRPQGQVTKQGDSGSPVKLQANYFKLLSTTDWCIYQYHVDFAPEEDQEGIRRGLLKCHKDTLGPYIFNGTVLYTKNRLPKKMELFSKRLSDDAQIRISIKEVGDLVTGDYHYLQFFNILMRRCLGHLNLQLVGREFYDALAKIEIPDYKLELWPGYLTSIRQHERNILMCAEIDHKVMRQKTLLHILNDCRHNSRTGDPRKDFAATVIGQVVLTAYNNRTYRIDDVDFGVTPKSTFPLHNGVNITYLDYYWTKYKIKIQNATQPLLVSRTKPRERRAGQGELVYLVPELCRATGITDDMRNQWQLMKALSDHMRVGPNSRIQKLLAFNKRLRSEPRVVADLEEWNMKLSENLVDVPGRQLKTENIIFAKETRSAGPEADWSRELSKVTMLSSGTLDNWALITTSRFKQEANLFVSKMIQVAGKLGFRIMQPRVHQIGDDFVQSYLTGIEEVLSHTAVKLIFCVVPNNRPERYSAIKKKCCIDRPVPTQVLLAKTLTKESLSIATKVAIQLNCKIGGAPWTIANPLTNAMVVGFDVCHDTVNKGRDYGALVASLDNTFSQYFSAVSEHTNGEELSNDIATNMCKALHAYRKRNNALPQRIIIYRDGVGEGQIPYVYQHEVEQLKARLAQVYGEQPVRMAFIIVTKRLHTRLFLKNMNPGPGTVVDDVITDPIKYDFFIVSQSVRQGSVSPTSYSVISDTVGLSADQIQRITYKLTHMYFNWSGTVKVPAPCQYAHKLAYMVSKAIHRMPHNNMDKLLYFL